MLNTDFLLELLLAENGLILLALLTLVVRYLRSGPGQRIEATLETVDSGISAGAERAEDAYEKLKFQYGELKDLYLAYRQGAQDGVSRSESNAVGEDLKQFKDFVEEKFERLMPTGAGENSQE
ncbi:hypothetical protein U2F10_03055 [Leptothoe sp. EHU-05/26/07-4]